MTLPNILHRGAPEFDVACERLIWNKRLASAHSPSAIASPRSAAEVAALVRHAAENGLAIGLRSGGHNYEASPLKNGGLLLDLGGLDAIEIDTQSRAAWVGPGVLGGELIAELSDHELAFPIGHCPDVGLGGYLLSGGFGWNEAVWGPACISVREVELVLASGEIVRASEHEHPELFWAVRGAGCGFFAVATGFRLALHDLPSAAFASTVAFGTDSAPVLADWLSDASRAAYRGAEITCMVGPHFKTGQPSIMLRADAVADSHDEARRRIAPLLSPPAAAQRIGEPDEHFLDFAKLTKLSAMPTGKRVAADHLWGDAPIGEMLLAVRHLAGIPEKASTINLFGLGGVGEVRHRPNEQKYALSVGGGIAAGIYGLWSDPADDARHIDWVAQANEALAPFRAGRYVGEAALTTEPDRAAQCFTRGALDRIEQLRQRYDPSNLFGGFPA